MPITAHFILHCHILSGRALTESLCKQLKLVYNIIDEVPEDYKSLCEVFPAFIAHASEERPLCIVIDSLDQLTDEDGARRFLEWLPRKLPAHACMIVSTLPEEGGCMQRLKTFCIPPEQFLQVNNSCSSFYVNSGYAWYSSQE